MNILCVSDILGEKLDRSTASPFANLLKECSGPDDHVKAVYIDELIFEVSNEGLLLLDSQNNQELKPDIVFVRGREPIGLHVSRFCKHKGIPCINDYSDYKSRTKFSQLIYFFESQATILRTIFSVNSGLLIKSAESRLGYPYILKTNMGSHGDSNYLIKDKDHAEKIIKEEPETEFVAQEYCPNDRDYRILIIGNKELIFERRGGVDTHLNNTSKGGLAKIAEDDLPKDIVSKARQLALGYNLTLSGVDTMPKLDSDEYYFLEINFQPQIATGVLLDEKKLLITELLKSLDKD